jgi:uncharacterized protein involved in exopolysaccharide biosynthesis
MVQTYTATAQQPAQSEQDQAIDLGHYIGVFRRRIFYFAIPFVLILIIGFLISAIQRPIYRAEGKILVEPPAIPTDLVEPTVTGPATERIEVIQQRIMNRDNLLSIVKKFGLFATEQRWMSGTQLLDLMRDRAEIQLVDIDTEISQSKDGKKLATPAAPRPNNKNPAIAFTISFEYENPELAMKVANEFLTMILNEDVRARTNRATETTQFLAQEVKRLQGGLDSLNAQIFEAKRNAPISEVIGRGDAALEKFKSQVAVLTAMKADLVQKETIYSEAHPAVKSLKKRIAALEKEISQAPKVDPIHPQPTTNIDELEQQQTSIAKNLDDASKKLIAARLGESMERNQQSEPLLVIEQPTVPQQPVKPKRLKLFAVSFALAAIAGVGAVFLVEMFDKSIRGSQELVGVIDSRLVVAIPYISTTGEMLARKHKIIRLWAFLAVALSAGIAGALYIGIEIDFSWFDRPWLASLTHLSK